MAIAASSVPEVVGFSGTPVIGGAGIVPPILEQPEGLFFTDTGKPPATRYGETELRDFADRGLLCRTRKKWPAVTSGVVIYAHVAFVKSPDGLDLSDMMSDFDKDEELDIFVAYIPWREAFQRLARWGEALLNDAEAQARQQNFRRMLDDAERAGYAVHPTPPDERRDDSLNRRVFVCLGAAYIGLKRNLDDVLDDVRIDFSEPEVRDIAKEARRLAHVLFMPPDEYRPLARVIQAPSAQQEAA